MTLKARLARFTCPHYDPQPSSKRCRSYLRNGGCVRPDHFMCDAWLKANGHALPTQGTAVTATMDERIARSPPGGSARPSLGTAGPSFAEPEMHLGGKLSAEEIASFKALGLEVCIVTEEIGEVWLVPEYTGQDRCELRIDHAATLAVLCSVFPGGKLRLFRKASATRSSDTTQGHVVPGG